MGKAIWDFSHSNIIVTGGSRGIGRATVMKLATAGAHVYFTYDKNEPAAEEVTRWASDTGVTVTAIQCSFDREYDYISSLKKVVPRDVPVHGLVNNAAIVNNVPFYTITDAQWHRMIDVNVTAVFRITRALYKQLILGKGSLVNVASTVAFTGSEGKAHYSAAKAAIVGLTKSLAKEMGQLGLRANVVAPGFTDTDALLPAEIKSRLAKQTILRRFASPDDIASAIVFLLSNEAAYITGETIITDGGLVIV